MTQILIFTDLDGTLLNYTDYSFKDALPSLEKIRQKAIPLILNTSKTRRETEDIQLEMGIDDPFIVENGAAIYFTPRHVNFLSEDVNHESPHVIELGICYDRIRAFIEEVKGEFNIRGFGDMSAREISGITGLPLKGAELAKARQYTEPFILAKDQDINMLQAVAKKQGVKIAKGGRLHHMTGMHHDKGVAVKIVRNLFDRKIGEKHLTIGLGDSINDLPMLNNVDIPVLIPHHENEFPKVHIRGLIRAESPGSKGWNDVIMGLMDKFLR